MNETKIIQIVLRLKTFSAALLFLCLLLLTCANFIIYTSCNTVEVELLSDLNGEENLPITPEEKSANNNISIQEEYVHYSDHESDNLALNNRTHCMIIGAAELSTVHFELISPPPDLSL